MLNAPRLEAHATPDPLSRHVLRFGLPSVTDEEPIRLDESTGADLLAAVRRNRCVGLLCSAVNLGSVELPQSLLGSFETAVRETAGVALMLEAVLLDLAEDLNLAGIGFRVIKGPSLAHTVYELAEWRDFGDIDVLVRGEDMAAVVALLERRNGSRLFEPVGRRYERWVGKSVTMRTFAGWEIDLHRNIAHGPWGGLIDPETLWESSGSFTLGGRELPTLSAAAHLAHALVHVGLGSPTPRWSNLRDIAQLSSDRELDRSTTIALLDRWQARVPAGIAAGWSAEATEAELRWLAAPRPPTSSESRWLALYRQPGEFRNLSLEALRAPIGWRARLRYAAAVAPLAIRRSESRVLRHLAGQPMTRDEALAMRGANAIGETPTDGWSSSSPQG